MKLWPNVTVPYYIAKRMSRQKRRLISKSISHWENKTCLRFVPAFVGSRQVYTDYVVFTSASRGCYSDSIGKLGGRQVINLGQGSIKPLQGSMKTFLMDEHKPRTLSELKEAIIHFIGPSSHVRRPQSTLTICKRLYQLCKRRVSLQVNELCLFAVLSFGLLISVYSCIVHYCDVQQMKLNSNAQC